MTDHPATGEERDVTFTASGKAFTVTATYDTTGDNGSGPGEGGCR